MLLDHAQLKALTNKSLPRRLLVTSNLKDKGSVHLQCPNPLFYIEGAVLTTGEESETNLCLMKLDNGPVSLYMQQHLESAHFISLLHGCSNAMGGEYEIPTMNLVKLLEVFKLAGKALPHIEKVLCNPTWKSAFSTPPDCSGVKFSGTTIKNLHLYGAQVVFHEEVWPSRLFLIPDNETLGKFFFNDNMQVAMAVDPKMVFTIRIEQPKKKKSMLNAPKEIKFIEDSFVTSPACPDAFIPPEPPKVLSLNSTFKFLDL